MTPTQEQQECIEVFMSGVNMKINAYAGSGKTTTLKLLAAERSSPGVYLCFNKSIADAATKWFPETVACRTTHSFAFRQMINRYRNSGKDKMAGKLRARDTAELLELKDFPIFGGTDRIESITLGYIINETVKRFFHSDATEVGREHFFIVPKLKTLPEDEFRYLRDRVVSSATVLWEMMHDPQTTVPLGHDGYVKAWHLSGPVIDTCYILIDEAQDTNPVMLDILKKQEAQVVYVGDKHQQIYEWRGAVNAMETAPTKRTVNLTKSFRFGQAIADFASEILATIGETNRIVGNEAVSSSLTRETQKAVLCRTNGTILDRLIDFERHDPTKRIHVVGGVSDLMDCMEGVERLQANRQSAYSAFIGFNDWREFEVYATSSGDMEAEKIVKLVDKYGVRELKSCLRNIYPSEEKAEILLTTAHKSKGREWHGVELADDFKAQPEKDPDTEELTYNQPESRLFYVAATRAINQLKVPQWARDIYAGDSAGTKLD